MNSKQAFYSGFISIIIGSVISYGVHAFWISTNNLIWALISVGHASFWSGMFSSINKS
jgi:hypothetical protein